MQSTRGFENTQVWMQVDGIYLIFLGFGNLAEEERVGISAVLGAENRQQQREEHEHEAETEGRHG